jgi:hypothetical protein
MESGLAFFLSRWGAPTTRVLAQDGALNQLSHLVPSSLVDAWRSIGFSAFKEGLMAVCNPMEWQSTLEEWISGTELESLDRFIPVMRSAFGDMRLFGIRNGHHATVSPVWGAYFGDRRTPSGELGFLAESTLVFSDPKDFDSGDQRLTFSAAVRKLGPLQPNEIYGFVHVLPMGGTRDLDHLQKVDAFAHLSILRQATGELRGIMEYDDLRR